MEADKYFWLAGAEGERAAAAIRVYLTRHRRSSGLQLYQDLPAAARLEDWDPYPENVSRMLHERGLDRLPRRSEIAAAGEGKVLPTWVAAGCLVVGIALLAAVVAGAIDIVRWLVGLI